MYMYLYVTGLDRTQHYVVECGELDADITRPDVWLVECQAEETETSSAAVTTDLDTTEEPATTLADGSITQRIHDASKDDSEEMALPYSLIGGHARTHPPFHVPLIPCSISICISVLATSSNDVLPSQILIKTITLSCHVTSNSDDVDIEGQTMMTSSKDLRGHYRFVSGAVAGGVVFLVIAVIVVLLLLR